MAHFIYWTLPDGKPHVHVIRDSLSAKIFADCNFRESYLHSVPDLG